MDNVDAALMHTALLCAFCELPTKQWRFDSL